MGAVAPPPEPAEEGQTPEEDGEYGGPVKTFLEHLEDLRWVIIKVVVAVGVAMILCMFAGPVLVEVLKRPLIASGIQEDVRIQAIGPISGFMVVMKLAFWGGLAISFPLILYFIGDFVIPALKPNEKRFMGWGFAISAGLFVVGAAFAFFWILPASLKAFVVFNQWVGLPAEFWDAKEYFPFVSKLVLGVGASFELPVVVLTLVRMGLFDYKALITARKYMVVGNLILAAFITPQDILSTIMMAAPMQLLYEACIWIAKYWSIRDAKREAVE